MTPNLWYVEQFPLDDLWIGSWVPAHTPGKREWFDALTKNMADHGLASPLLVGPDRRVRCGSNRLQAARILGWDAVPVLIYDTPAPEGAVEVQSLEAAQAYLRDGTISHNERDNAYCVTGAMPPESGVFPKPDRPAPDPFENVWYIPDCPLSAFWGDTTKHHADWYEELKKDIAERGLLSPLVVRNRRIRVGGCRLKVLYELGWTSAPVIWFGDPPRGVNAVRLSGKEEAESYLHRGEFYITDRPVPGSVEIRDVVPATEWKYEGTPV